MAIIIKPSYRGRTIFLEEELGIRLDVPGPVEDHYIRQRLYIGGSMAEAYGYADVLGLYPIEPLRPCCEAVLRAMRFNAALGYHVLETWTFTYDEFYKCIQEYVRATLEFPEGRGRMEIGPGVYAPSSSEELCIKGAFHKSGDIANAYLICGASDVFPKWTGAAEVMATALGAQPAADLYDIVMTAYMMRPADPPPPVHIPPQVEAKIPWGLALVGVLALALLTR